ncbi:cobalamin biosynthesis protein [Paraglaciecola sp. L3A3]|uniref:cobalamin biosynthesis protein CobD/CbiB n=1 Tax=Paraglaciecola sp. L3A3 TaxID=2686358 RepID=UPI00131AB015|nr:cobalamin biosynthesis protein [Paraglaciecola sp. L3A3]
MQALIEVLTSQFWLSYWTLLIIVVVEKNLSWPEKYHPLSLYKLFAIRMAKKVLPSADYSTQQQKISGALAAMVLLLPLIVIIAIFIYLSEYPMFFQGFLLLIALRFQYVLNISTKIANYLSADKKILARHTLQPIILRETDKLSPMGLAKANCETIVLRFSYQYCAVIFWFLLTGGVGAIIYRALYESSQCWNIKLKRFKHFGLIVNKLLRLLQWTPNFLVGLSLIIVSANFASLKVLKTKRSYFEQRFYLLNIAGTVLNIELGGPAFYENKKTRTEKCGGIRQVTLADILRTKNILNLSTYLWLTLCFLGYTFIFININ